MIDPPIGQVRKRPADTVQVEPGNIQAGVTHIVEFLVIKNKKVHAPDVERAIVAAFARLSRREKDGCYQVRVYTPDGVLVDPPPESGQFWRTADLNRLKARAKEPIRELTVGRPKQDDEGGPCCVECGEDRRSHLAYQDRHASGEQWQCKTCGHEFQTTARPQEG
jgi:hypothetical protein